MDLGISSQLGWRWLLFGFFRFFGLALLSFSHNRSPCSVNMLKYAATNVALLNMYQCR
jgi:hypothetical protein